MYYIIPIPLPRARLTAPGTNAQLQLPGFAPAVALSSISAPPPVGHAPAVGAL